MDPDPSPKSAFINLKHLEDQPFKEDTSRGSQSPARSPKKRLKNAKFLILPNNKKVSYIFRPTKFNQSAPTVFLIHGRGGSIHSARSEAVQKHCEKNDIGFFAYDLYGHGNADGEKSEMMVSDWLQQLQDVKDSYFATLSSNPEGEKLIVSGYSLGKFFFFEDFDRWVPCLFGFEGKGFSSRDRRGFVAVPCS
jgi:pimeloyl-ACP methyl ester carboxylesterase